MITSFPFPVSWILITHISGGLVALLTFLIPLFAKKGGKLHTRVGWIYLGAMFLVVVGAFLITPWRYFMDVQGTTQTRTSAVFLFFIAVLTLTAMQQGIYVLRHKKREIPILSLGTVGLPVALLLVSSGVLWLGISIGNIRFIAFPIIGGRAAVSQLGYWKNPPTGPQSWWFYHLENMFACCIATVTAFVVTAVPRLYPSIYSNSVFVWLAPTFILVPWMIWFKKKYERKFGIIKKG